MEILWLAPLAAGFLLAGAVALLVRFLYAADFGRIRFVDPDSEDERFRREVREALVPLFEPALYKELKESVKAGRSIFVLGSGGTSADRLYRILTAAGVYGSPEWREVEKAIWKLSGKFGFDHDAALARTFGVDMVRFEKLED